MVLHLVFDDFDRICIPLDDGALEAWRLQLDRAIRAGSSSALCGRLASSVAASIEQCLDRDLQPPTENQVRYAMAIARELNVSLSGDALRYRGSMGEFLTRFSEVYKVRRSRSPRRENDPDPPDAD